MTTTARNGNFFYKRRYTSPKRRDQRVAILLSRHATLDTVRSSRMLQGTGHGEATIIVRHSGLRLRTAELEWPLLKRRLF
jgi:hypothetical protein